MDIPYPVINSYSFSNGGGGVFSEPWNVGEKVNYRCEEQFHKKEDWKLVPDPAGSSGAHQYLTLPEAAQ